MNPFFFVEFFLRIGSYEKIEISYGSFLSHMKVSHGYTLLFVGIFGPWLYLMPEKSPEFSY
jgi:hypothetical protein